jgi:hypothetical protein
MCIGDSIIEIAHVTVLKILMIVKIHSFKKKTKTNVKRKIQIDIKQVSLKKKLK